MITSSSEKCWNCLQWGNAKAFLWWYEFIRRIWYHSYGRCGVAPVSSIRQCRWSCSCHHNTLVHNRSYSCTGCDFEGLSFGPISNLQPEVLLSSWSRSSTPRLQASDNSSEWQSEWVRNRRCHAIQHKVLRCEANKLHRIIFAIALSELHLLR